MTVAQNPENPTVGGSESIDDVSAEDAPSTEAPSADTPPANVDGDLESVSESTNTSDEQSNSEYGWDVIRQINPDLGSNQGIGTPSNGVSNSPLYAEGEETFQKAFLRMIFGLSVVLALILLVYYLIRRFGKGMPALSGAQLGQVIGQLHLSRDATLHYVRTGGRVLLVGVNANGIHLVAEFDAAAFDGNSLNTDIQRSFDPEAFLGELENQTNAYSESGSNPEPSDADDGDVAMLRSDIHRLQEYLREESRESKD